MKGGGDDGSGDEELADVVDTLGNRTRMLRELAEAPAEPRELRDRLDISRSTVTRALRRLEQLGLVDRRDDGYGITLAGRVLYHEYESFTDTVGSVAGASEVLNLLPPDVPMSTRLLVEGEVLVAEPPDSSRPGRRMVEIVGDADAFWGLTKSYSTANASEVYRERLESGTEVELVYDREMFEYLIDRDEWFGPAIADGQVVAHVSDDVPYGLFLVDGGDARTTCLLVYDDGNLTGAVVSEDPEVWDWGERVFEHYRSAAQRIDPERVTGAAADD